MWLVFVMNDRSIIAQYIPHMDGMDYLMDIAIIHPVLLDVTWYCRTSFCPSNARDVARSSQPLGIGNFHILDKPRLRLNSCVQHTKPQETNRTYHNISEILKNSRHEYQLHSPDLSQTTHSYMNAISKSLNLCISDPRTPKFGFTQPQVWRIS